MGGWYFHILLSILTVLPCSFLYCTDIIRPFCGSVISSLLHPAAIILLAEQILVSTFYCLQDIIIPSSSSQHCPVLFVLGNCANLRGSLDRYRYHFPAVDHKQKCSFRACRECTDSYVVLKEVLPQTMASAMLIRHLLSTSKKQCIRIVKRHYRVVTSKESLATGTTSITVVLPIMHDHLIDRHALRPFNRQQWPVRVFPQQPTVPTRRRFRWHCDELSIFTYLLSFGRGEKTTSHDKHRHDASSTRAN